jgi:hypothetical protein
MSPSHGAVKSQPGGSIAPAVRALDVETVETECPYCKVVGVHFVAWCGRVGFLDYWLLWCQRCNRMQPERYLPHRRRGCLCRRYWTRGFLQREEREDR